MTLAARFGTPVLLPAIESSGARQQAANPNDSSIAGALLAAEMRENPDAALERLQQGKVSVTSWYETNKVFESAQQPFPPRVNAWLRDQVRIGDDRAARQGAYELSIGGTADDRAVIEQRLAKFRLNASETSGDPSSTTEADLVSSLFNAKAWTLTADEREAVTRGCITDGCRNFAKR